VKVVDVGAVFLGVVAEWVGGAVGDAAFDATAGEPDVEPLHVMIPPHSALVPLGHGRAAEFTAPHDERVLEHSLPLEVRDEAGDGAVD